MRFPPIVFALRVRGPAGGDLVGLAVHPADDLGLVAGDAALTRVRAAAWR